MNADNKSVGPIRQRILIGALVELDLGNGNFAYARIVSKSELAFYDRLVKGGSSCAETMYGAPIAFVISVMNSAVRSGRWKIVGKQPLEPEFAQERRYFIHDALTGQYSVYDGVTGDIHPSSAELCAGLERAAVWDAEHVEDRLRDHFAGRPNVWLTQMNS